MVDKNNMQVLSADEDFDTVFNDLMMINPPQQVAVPGVPKSRTPFPSPSTERKMEVAAPQNRKTRAYAMLLARLGGVNSTFRPLETDFLAVHLRGDEVVVFFDLEGKDGIIKEDSSIFPSDQIVAQLKLVLGA